MPLPLAMMIPFMGIQSMVMAKQFGENFQYGKRRISAMSNDEFNKLTPAKLLSNANDELKSQIPLMEASMTDMRNFQQFIVKEFLLTIRSIIDAGLGKLIGLTPTEINETVQNIEHFLHGHFEGHTATGAPDPIVPPPSPPTGLRSLSLSEVSALSDSTLLQFIGAIQEFDAQTQQFLINERERRGPETVKEEPSEEQQTTKLHPDFIASLTLSDLLTGGHRVRNYKGAIQKWWTKYQLNYHQNLGVVKISEHSTKSGWFNTGSAGKASNLAGADLRVNEYKRQVGANYVVAFGTRYFLIFDDF